MGTILGGGVATYMTILALLFFLQRSLLYAPDRRRPNLADAGLAPAMRAIELVTADGLRLLAWYQTPAANAGPLLLYLHGNAGHIGDRGERVRPYFDAGFGVLLVEFRGYGGNPGRPSEA